MNKNRAYLAERNAPSNKNLNTFQKKDDYFYHSPNFSVFDPSWSINMSQRLLERFAQIKEKVSLSS